MEKPIFPRLAPLILLFLLLSGSTWPAAGTPKQEVRGGGLRLTPEAQTLLETLPALHGPSLAIGSLKTKVVAVTFFASWCPPCREEMAHLKKLYRAHHPRGFEVVAINLFEEFDNFSNARQLDKFLRETNPGFPIVKGTESVSLFFGKIRRIPTLFVFDRAGDPALRFTNERQGRSTTVDPEKLEALIGRLVSPVSS